MSWAGTACEMSTIVAAGLIERITPFIAATYGLPVPKSVVRVMMGIKFPSLINSSHNSRKRFGLTLGFFFLAWPISCPRPLLAFLDFGDNLGVGGQQLAAEVLQGRIRRPRRCPCACIVSSSGLPPAIISANTSRPRLVVNRPLRTVSISSASCLGRKGNCSMAICCSLSVRSTSCWTQLLASLPSPQQLGQVDVVIHQRPALVHQHVAVVGRDAVGLLPAGARSAAGNSPSDAANPLDLAPRSTVTGTRSGSGK